MGARLMAIVAEGDRGRVYLPPTERIEAVARQAKPDVEAGSSLSAEHTVISVSRPYGMELFAATSSLRANSWRLTTFSDLVQEARERVKRDAVAAGLPDDGKPLIDGGTGATAYADAVAVYLGLRVGRSADYWSTQTSWGMSGAYRSDLRAPGNSNGVGLR